MSTNKKARQFVYSLNFDVSSSMINVKKCIIQCLPKNLKKNKSIIYLQLIGIKNRIQLAQYLIDSYHQYAMKTGNGYNMFISECILFDQLQNINQSQIYFALKQYIIDYECFVYKPIPIFKFNQYIPVKIRDNINIYLKYLLIINEISRSKELKMRPIQLDVYIIPTECIKNDNIINFTKKKFQFKDIKHITSTKQSRADNDVPYTVYHDLINTITRVDGEIMKSIQYRTRIIVIIHKQDINNTDNDVIHFFISPNKLNNLIYGFSELSWIMNSKQENILPNLSYNDDGILNISVHLHPKNHSSKIYLGYNSFGCRVFKQNIINNLRVFFDGNNSFNQQILNTFNQQWTDLNDAMFDKYQKYFFSPT